MRVKQNTHQMVLISLFTAMLVVLSQIAIPLPSGIPITLQTFAVALSGFVLGTKRGTLCVAIYLLLGAIGLPVFAGFMGGVGKLFGITGGFLFGFLLMVAFCGRNHMMLSLVGLILCHVLGVAQFSLFSGTPFFQSILIVSLPYLIKDTLSVVAAFFAAKAVQRGLVAARLTPR